MDQRIGSYLSKITPLSDHDVEEILQEQSATRQPFGDIALRLGLCTPEDLLRAWLRQLETRIDRVDIDRVGVDTQALIHLSPEQARQYVALPLRALEDEVLLAVAHLPDEATLAEIESAMSRRVRIVLANEAVLVAAIERYYPSKSTDQAA